MVSWRERRFHTLADGMANAAMDNQRDLRFAIQGLQDFQPGQVLQWHSDGGFREASGCAAAAFTCTLIRRSSGDPKHVDRHLMLAESHFLLVKRIP